MCRLTHAFEPVQSVWPGFGNAKFKPAKAGKTIEEYIDTGQEFVYDKHGFVVTALKEKSCSMVMNHLLLSVQITWKISLAMPVIVRIISK